MSEVSNEEKTSEETKEESSDYVTGTDTTAGEKAWEALDEAEQRALIKRHHEVSVTVRRTTFALLAYAAFSVVSIFQSDIGFLLPTKGVKLPFADVPMDAHAFVIVGPIGLIVITIYLQIFIGLLDRFKAVPAEERNLSLFNVDMALTRVLMAIVFYAVPPLVMGAYAWKALILPDVKFWLIGASAMVLVISVVLLSHRLRLRRSITACVAVLTAVYTGILTTTHGLDRVMNLERADLKGQRLLGLDLEGANLRYAILDGVNLDRARLVGADLYNVSARQANFSLATLIGADLSEADFTGAILNATDLSDADLERARFIDARMKLAQLKRAYGFEAVLTRADLSGADLRGAKLTSAILHEAKFALADRDEVIFDLKWQLGIDDLKGAERFTPKTGEVRSGIRAVLIDADLRSANLSMADLSGADLSGADLSSAILAGAVLDGAVLKNANISSASLSEARKLTQDQVTSACYREGEGRLFIPDLPEGFELPPACTNKEAEKKWLEPAT
jgi:uncharacterized protein YjbI with pentapeptide repeats